jgi:hypothetical protein
MTVADLREILNDPDLPPDTPVRVQVGHDLGGRTYWSTWAWWTLEGAHGTLAGPDRHLVLELRSAHPTGEESDPA